MQARTRTHIHTHAHTHTHTQSLCPPIHPGPLDHGYAKALAAFEASLKALQRPQLDLYLVHWPGVQGWKREDPRNASLRRETWAAMEELLRTG